jgi:AsmA protein
MLQRGTNSADAAPHGRDGDIFMSVAFALCKPKSYPSGLPEAMASPTK